MRSVFSAFFSEGYDWSEFHVYRHPRDSRKYVVDVQGGCSCNSYETPEDLESETPLGKRQVYAEFSRWWGNGSLGHEGTKVDNLSRLRDSL